MKIVIEKRTGGGIDLIPVTIKRVKSPFFSLYCKGCPDLFGFKAEKTKIKIACKAKTCTRKLKNEST